MSKGKTGDAKYKLRDQVSWATPDVSSDNRQPKEGWTWNGTHWLKEDGTKVQTSLKHQTEHWATPNTRDHKGKSQFKNQESLPNQVSLNCPDWPTPTITGNNNSKGSSEKSGNGLGTEVKQWGTPRSSMLGHEPGRMDKSNLEDQVWPTPTSMQINRSEETMKKAADYRKKKANQDTVPLYLAEVVMITDWPTPRSSEWKGTGPKGSESQKYRLEKQYLDATVEEIDGQPAPENPSTNGKRPGLNPAWVMQLMGTTIEKTFFAWRETPLYVNSQKKRSEPCS
jgi:hypothetical protein